MLSMTSNDWQTMARKSLVLMALLAVMLTVGCGGGSRNRRDDDEDEDRPAKRNFGGGPRNGEELDEAAGKAERHAEEVARNIGSGSGAGYTKGGVIEFWPRTGLNPYVGKRQRGTSPDGRDMFQCEHDVYVARSFHTRRHVRCDELELYLSDEMGSDIMQIGGTDAEDDDARTVIEYEADELSANLRNVDGGNRAYVFEQRDQDVSDSMADMDLPVEMRKVRMNCQDFGEDGEDDEGGDDDHYFHFTKHSGDPTRSAWSFWSADPDVHFTCNNADDEGGVSLGVVIGSDDEEPREREMPVGPRRNNPVDD